MSEACLSQITAAMTAYKDAKTLVDTYQLDFLTEEVSNMLERAKKLKRVLEASLDLPAGRMFIQPVLAMTNLGSTTKEMRASIIKNLEENLSFLTSSREDLNQALIALFDAWDAYVGGRYDAAVAKTSQSVDLERRSVRNCLVGIAREYIRRAHSRISAGRKIFASLKDARKKLDIATADFSRYERELTNTWNDDAKAALESVIKTAKEAGAEAQYSIDDAKLPFIVTLITAILGTIGGVWTLYNC